MNSPARRQSTRGFSFDATDFASPAIRPNPDQGRSAQANQGQHCHCQVPYQIQHFLSAQPMPAMRCRQTKGRPHGHDAPSNARYPEIKMNQPPRLRQLSPPFPTFLSPRMGHALETEPLGLAPRKLPLAGSMTPVRTYSPKRCCSKNCCWQQERSPNPSGALRFLTAHFAAPGPAMRRAEPASSERLAAEHRRPGSISRLRCLLNPPRLEPVVEENG